MKRKSIGYFIFLLIISFSFSFSSCGSNSAGKITVSWLDVDGTIIEKTYIESNSDFQERELPADTEEWHYTGWKTVFSDDLIICVAQRIRKNHYTWMDYDGTIIKDIITTDVTQEIPSLPASTDKWEYTEWKKDVNGDNITFTAQRFPNTNYFLGNVFQIILYNEEEEPISTGSGFVINSDGWFITNSHVMEDAVSATAYFDIPDIEKQEKYVKLFVSGGVYNNEEKDIFIGKLSNYQKIKDNYRDIVFTEDYVIGQTTYTVGYPNSSLFMEINKGELIEEYTDIYGKIYNSYYLLSNSYIAPGSSGGILINEQFEVIGITTVGFYADSNKSIYIASGSVPTSLFYSQLNNLNESDIKPIKEIN